MNDQRVPLGSAVSAFFFRRLSLVSPVKNRWDILAFGIILVVITLSSIPPLASGGKLNFNDDFLQYASRHEAVRKSLLEYHTFPLRSHWLGGGFPTLGDPEDPSLNPLVLLSIPFGTVMGLKVIPFLALLVGGLSMYVLTRYILGYTRWGALFAGLIFSTSLFVPFRIQDGNPNEVYAAFLPLVMLLIGLSCQGRKIALLILPFVLYTMLSDGKLNALMAIFYVGMLCLLDIVPMFGTFTGGDACVTKSKNLSRKIHIRPTKILILALFVTFFLGMVRFLPALELIDAKGGLRNIDLAFHPKTYRPEGVYAYTFEQLWQETVGWKERLGLVTIGWVPVTLFGLALVAFWRKSLPWAINLLLFGWLILAYNAPVDLLRPLWKLPIFSALYRPYKYFSFQIMFTFAVASGQSFWLLRKLRPKWLEHLLAIILITAGVWFLYPKMVEIQRDTYTYEAPVEFPASEKEFYNIQGQGLTRNRKEPFRSVAYFNLPRNVGTIDWYTGIPIAENAIPKYFVDKKNNYVPNPKYRGEVFFSEIEDAKAKGTFRPNSITVQVDIQTPGILVVNQNYHRDWHTNKGELFNRNGLIALRLQEIGSYMIRMRYISRSFYTGLAISVFSLTALVFICWIYKTGRLLGWSQHASPLLRWSSRTILWLID